MPHLKGLIYGVFFAPNEYYEEVAKDFKNINFDEIAIAKKYKDFPDKECENILSQKEDLQKQVQAKEDSINSVIEENKTKLVSAIRRIETAYSNFDVGNYQRLQGNPV